MNKIKKYKEKLQGYGYKLDFEDEILIDEVKSKFYFKIRRKI